MLINNFSDFCNTLLSCGFSMGGSNSKGIFTIIPNNTEEQMLIESPIKWHTGDIETDPWEWRMRVLEERNDIAYSKLFFCASGYITKDWYPYFYSVRRQGESLDEAYFKGKISRTAKRIYEIIDANKSVPLHEIKLKGNFKREDNARFDSALTELQMRMFISMCGRKQKLNKYGETYGWNSTVFTTVEKFWQERDVYIADVNKQEAIEKITEQILKLNPNADIKKINKFIKG